MDGSGLLHSDFWPNGNIGILCDEVEGSGVLHSERFLTKWKHQQPSAMRWVVVVSRTQRDFWQWAHQLSILLWPDGWWWFTIFWHQILKGQFLEKFTNLLQETALESTEKRLIQFCTFSPLSRITPVSPQLTEFSLLMEISDVCTLKLREISNSGHANILLCGQNDF